MWIACKWALHMFTYWVALKKNVVHLKAAHKIVYTHNLAAAIVNTINCNCGCNVKTRNVKMCITWIVAMEWIKRIWQSMRSSNSETRTKKRKIKYMSSLCAICLGLVVEFDRFSFQSLANGVCVTNVTILFIVHTKNPTFYPYFPFLVHLYLCEQNDCLSWKRNLIKVWKVSFRRLKSCVSIFQLNISNENFDVNRSKIASWSIWFVVYFKSTYKLI